MLEKSQIEQEREWLQAVVSKSLDNFGNFYYFITSLDCV
jgi:hypothetical protein